MGPEEEHPFTLLQGLVQCSSPSTSTRSPMFSRSGWDIEEFRGDDPQVSIDPLGNAPDLLQGLFREGAPEVVEGDQALAGER
jgi:hypothetical protein